MLNSKYVEWMCSWSVSHRKLFRNIIVCVLDENIFFKFLNNSYFAYKYLNVWFIQNNCPLTYYLKYTQLSLCSFCNESPVFRVKAIVVEGSLENYYTFRSNQSFLEIEWEHYLKCFKKYLIRFQVSRLSPLVSTNRFKDGASNFWGFIFQQGSNKSWILLEVVSSEVIFLFIFVNRIKYTLYIEFQ